ncbi:MAG TPA: hypothetical protein VNV42_13510 [Solirubrobacteraceae bacterium]|jgi:hypothetical protein|nr:hypothetical protein [Solirubrobacteraceae bacterium]
MRRSTGGLTLAAVGAALVLLVVASPALADPSGGPRPSIESESASGVTATGATLEALVDPGTGEDGFALETTYEFFLESPWCGFLHLFGGCEASGGKLVYKGTIPSGTAAPQLESVDLASVGQKLSPETIYGYRVVARNEVGEAFGFEKTFTTFAEGTPPAIESVSVSHITRTDAILEATINTEDLPTRYAFQMWYSPCSKHGSGCELLMDVKLPCGAALYGSPLPQTVSLDLNSAGVVLGAGEYGFSVTAENAAGPPTTAAGGVFEALEEGASPLGPTGSTSTSSPGPGAGGQTTSPSTGQGTTSGGGSTATGTTSGGSVAPGDGFHPGGEVLIPKPKPKHGKHHKPKHHRTKAAKHSRHAGKRKK